jgi:ATP-dependent Lon protease
VRSLEREIAKICRKAVKQMLLNKKEDKHVSVTPKSLDKFLGVRRFRYGKAEDMNRIGQVTGLAWTEVGGELLSIEAAVVPGKGKLQHTGQLGEVMQESIQAAMTVVRSRAQVLGLENEFYQKHDVHLHIPEGATPRTARARASACARRWCRR